MELRRKKILFALIALLLFAPLATDCGLYAQRGQHGHGNPQRTAADAAQILHHGDAGRSHIHDKFISRLRSFVVFPFHIAALV